MNELMWWISSRDRRGGVVVVADVLAVDESCNVICVAW